ERSHQLRRRLFAIEHVQVVGGQSQIGARFHGLETEAAAVGGGKDGRERGGGVDRERDGGFFESVLHALNRYDAPQHVHRVCVLGQCVQSRGRRGGQRPGAGQLERQGVELRPRRQLAVPKKVRDLFEG